jgi:hypothetical protein
MACLVHLAPGTAIFLLTSGQPQPYNVLSLYIVIMANWLERG